MKKKDWKQPQWLRRGEKLEVWYYVNRGSIDLCIHRANATLDARITRQQLLRIIADVGARRAKS